MGRWVRKQRGINDLQHRIRISLGDDQHPFGARDREGRRHWGRRAGNEDVAGSTVAVEGSSPPRGAGDEKGDPGPASRRGQP